MARRRMQWTNRQSQGDPGRLVFIDETWRKANMEPLRGWAQRGERLVAKVPHGRWKPCTHRYEAGARGTLTKAGAFSGAASGLESGMNSRLFIAGVGEVELADGGEEGFDRA